MPGQVSGSRLCSLSWPSEGMQSPHRALEEGRQAIIAICSWACAAGQSLGPASDLWTGVYSLDAAPSSPAAPSSALCPL